MKLKMSSTCKSQYCVIVYSHLGSFCPAINRLEMFKIQSLCYYGCQAVNGLVLLLLLFLQY